MTVKVYMVGLICRFDGMTEEFNAEKVRIYGKHVTDNFHYIFLGGIWIFYIMGFGKESHPMDVFLAQFCAIFIFLGIPILIISKDYFFRTIFLGSFFVMILSDIYLDPTTDLSAESGLIFIPLLLLLLLTIISGMEWESQRNSYP